MASRTNKQGIAKKKAQLQKQASRTKWAKRFEYPKRRLDLNDGKDWGAITGFLEVEKFAGKLDLE